MNSSFHPESIAEKQLSALFEVSSILSRSLDYQQARGLILKVLHDQAMLKHAMLTLLDDSGEQLHVDNLYISDNIPTTSRKKIQYKAGEGIVGSVLHQKESIVIPSICKDFRFVDKLDIYDQSKPFIAVPVRLIGGEVIGVLAAQPEISSVQLLPKFNRFMEMCANLIGRYIMLSKNIAQQTDNLQAERDQLRQKVRRNYNLDNMVGHSKAMHKIFEQIRIVSKWGTTVLVRGESGTGKELIANAIHYNSPRATGAFVKLNCAALPDNLLESELFGHEKGAFTGAIKQRKGRFESADGGTLFLDEIGEVSPAFQAKLLRVVQEGEFERVGGTQTIRVDVRIIAATNRNLEKDVQEGSFREDLYYRLNVMAIYSPSLRERLEDLPELTDFLLDKLSKKQNRKLKITDRTIRHMMKYHWPGNVRQLENMLERASVMSESGVIDKEVMILDNIPSSTVQSPSQPPTMPTESTFVTADMNDRDKVVAALKESGWVQAKAARLLNITPRQIAYRIKTMNIEMKQI
ncbi:MAG: nif-specific transcriptional activator NifA [Colwellia sp.]